MISRSWWGVTKAIDAETYLGYVYETGIKSLRATPGNLAALCLRRIRDDRAEFVVWSLWESEDAIRAFAGPDFQNAVYYPDDFDYLIEQGDLVDHYEVMIHEGCVPEVLFEDRGTR